MLINSLTVLRFSFKLHSGLTLCLLDSLKSHELLLLSELIEFSFKFKLFTDSFDEDVTVFTCVVSLATTVVKVGCKVGLFKFKLRLGGTGFGLGAVCGVLAATVGGCLNEFVLTGC